MHECHGCDSSARSLQGRAPDAAPCPSHRLPAGAHTLSVLLFGDGEHGRGVAPFHALQQWIDREPAGVKKTLIHPLTPECSAISISLLRVWGSVLHK